MKSFFTDENITDLSLKKTSSIKDVDNCEKCKLYQNCLHPRIDISGEGKKNILLIFDNPGKQDDIEGESLRGETGKFIRQLLRDINIKLEQDCFKVFAVKCHAKNEITNNQINYCRPLLLKIISDLKPQKIITFGSTALNSLIGLKESITDDITRWVGCKIPDNDLNCFIFPNYLPVYIMKNSKDIVLNRNFVKYLKEAFDYNKPLIKYKSNIEILNDKNKVISFLSNLINNQDLFVFDYETTGLKPYTKGHEIICMSIAIKNKTVAFPIFKDTDFLELLKKLLESKNKKISHNLRFEHLWSKIILKADVKNWYWDTMIASHILDNRGHITGLKFQSYVNFGISGYNKSVDKYLSSDGGEFNIIKQADLNELLLYCGMDSQLTYQLYEQQKEQFNNDLILRKGLNFFINGATNLADIQLNGMRFDYNKYKNINIELTEKLNRLENQIYNNQDVLKWDLKTKFNFNSTKDLRHLFFNVLKWESNKKTKSGFDSLDKNVLNDIDNDLTRSILEHRKSIKIRDTYLAQFEREASLINNDYFIYPNFNLHTVLTYRSSSDSPNFQNIPSRDKDAYNLVRSLLIPRPGNLILEIDFKGMEVATSCCYHRDSNMIKYVTDLKNDMHRDIALKIFKRSLNDFTKYERFCAKNGFTFPEFYGSTSNIYLDKHKQIGAGDVTIGLWNMMNDESKSHLFETGIETLSDFQKHIEKIEQEFWNTTFKEYKQWKYDNWKFYKEKGFVELKTGFKCSALMGFNDVNNYPIQGSAFHILLWCLNRLNRFLKDNNFKSVIIGQIHDSMVLDVCPDEFDKLKSIILDISSNQVREYWKWIIVPLQIEMQATGVNESWNFKKDI